MRRYIRFPQIIPPTRRSEHQSIERKSGYYFKSSWPISTNYFLVQLMGLLERTGRRWYLSVFSTTNSKFRLHSKYNLNEIIISERIKCLGVHCYLFPKVHVLFSEVLCALTGEIWLNTSTTLMYLIKCCRSVLRQEMIEDRTLIQRTTLNHFLKKYTSKALPRPSINLRFEVYASKSILAGDSYTSVESPWDFKLLQSDWLLAIASLRGTVRLERNRRQE
jgi:hypothetical protein